MCAAQIRFGDFGDQVDPLVVEALLDHPKVGIVFSTRQNNVQMECRLSAGVYPSLEVTLLPLKFLPAAIDQTEKCILFCEEYGSVLTAYVQIVETVHDQKLRVLVTKTEQKKQKRDCFRVDTLVCLQYWQEEADKPNSSRGALQRVNLSGNGLRFLTESPVQEGDTLGLQLDMPQYYTESLNAYGRVVRVRPSKSSKQEVAVRLCEYEKTTQDKIVSFCITEQTRQIRLKSKL